MTKCIHGDHEFPVEDSTGAYCEEHGVTILWNSQHFEWDDLLAEPGLPSDSQESASSDTPQGS
ncbi:MULTISPECIES: hypothetical protein [unclassified Streptomyces]|uniref:hypothetical protein n=1 Tax=unclassified Streptomyces TaxID=2593676 RepID=UPI0040412281